VRQLLRAGAKPELTDMEGKTAIDYADAAGFDDAVEQLERAMASAVRRPPPPPAPPPPQPYACVQQCGIVQPPARQPAPRRHHAAPPHRARAHACAPESMHARGCA
jgi:hypothetical protein